MSDIVLSTQNGEPVVSSRDVARDFGKRHDHVMRDIEDIMRGLPKNGDTPMFYKTEYVHEQNSQTYPMYLMTRDGFTLVVMGLNNSPKVIEWKLKYIAAFNEMEKQLTQPKEEPRELMISRALVAAQSIIEDERKRSQQLEKENAKLKPAAEYAHNMLLSDETLTVTQIALNFGMTANKLNKLLEEWGIQKKVNKQWIPKRKYIDKGYTLSIPVEVGNGETKENTRWTRSGQAFLYKQLHDHGYKTVKEQQEEKAKERKVLPSPTEQTA